MADATLRIKIGVSVDADASRVFEPIERASARARKRVKENLDAATSAVKKPTPSGDDPYRETARKAVASAQMRVAAEAAASSQISAIRKREAAEADAERRKTVTAALNAAKAIAGAAGNAAGRGAKFAKDVVGEGGTSAYRALPGAVRFGRQVAGDLARGAGLNLDPVAAMQKGIGLEKKSVDLSNAGFMAGAKGPAGVRQDPKEILEGIRNAATATALDVGSAAEGLQAFVSKTGDLDTGRAVLGDLGKLARATGTDFGDMVSAAGDVATQLDEVGDKSQRVEKLNAIMRTVAGQGKLGAVEIKDLAVQMAKLSAVAPQFSGSFEENMGEMGALVQMARAKGGAASAPQAATSLGSFVSTLSKSARVKEFDARGIKLDDEKTGKLQNANVEVAAAEYDAEHADENDPMAKESAEFRLAAARKKQLEAKHEVDTAQEGITEKLGQYTKFKSEGLGADGTNKPGARLTAVAWMSDFREGITGSKSGFGRDELHSATAVADKLDAVVAAQKAMTAAITAGLKIASMPNGLPGMPPGSVTKDGDVH